MFLTRLPVPAWVDHHPAYLMRSMQFFPLVGALVGAWGAAWYGAAAVLWPAPPALAATVSTLATVWLTGCFHEDGLSDTFDGFGGGWGRDQILRIMVGGRAGGRVGTSAGGGGASSESGRRAVPVRMHGQAQRCARGVLRLAPSCKARPSLRHPSRRPPGRRRTRGWGPTPWWAPR